MVRSASVSVTVTANPVLTTFTLSSNLNAVPTGGSVVFTATAKDQSLNPLSGISVQALEGGVAIGSPQNTNASGQAMFTLNFPSVGNYSVTARGLQVSTGVSLTSTPISITVSTPMGTPPKTVAMSTNIGATKADCDHKLFFAAGRFWLWYMQDNNIVYISSTDKATWTSPVTVLSAGLGPGEMFDVFYDGPSGKVYFVWCLSTQGFTYAVGSPSASGAISWTTPLTQVSVPAANGPYGVNRPTIRPDSSGNVFVAGEVSVMDTSPVGHSVHIQVFRFMGNTWSTIRDFATGQASTDWMGILGKFTGGKMTLYYGTVNGGSTAYLEDWSGTTWSNPINMSGPARLEPMNGGGLTIGDTLYWGGFDTDSTGFIGYFHHTYGETVAPILTQLSGPNANVYISDGQGCISSDGVTSLVVFYSGSFGFGTGAGRFTVYFRTSTDLGITWQPELVFASGETGIQGKTLQCTDIASTREVQVAWTTNQASPYAVRFATLVL